VAKVGQLLFFIGKRYHLPMSFTWKMKARYLFRDFSAWNMLWRMKERKQEKAWEKAGRLGPPHIVKQRMLLDYAKTYNIETLVETGTFLGDMVYAMKDQFKDIYSIELSEELHQKAKLAFKKYPHIHLIAGDSGKQLDRILPDINSRCLFWLDGHYSGGITAMGEVWCPIRGELDAILRHPIKNHVILIDDSVCFDGKHGYPTLFELHDIIMNHLPGYEIQVFDNVIQVRPVTA
jgi:hypothetical protein